MFQLLPCAGRVFYDTGVMPSRPQPRGVALEGTPGCAGTYVGWGVCTYTRTGYPVHSELTSL